MSRYINLDRIKPWGVEESKPIPCLGCNGEHGKPNKHGKSCKHDSPCKHGKSCKACKPCKYGKPCKPCEPQTIIEVDPKVLYELEWDRKSVNLLPNQQVYISHGNGEFVYVQPKQKFSTPGVLTPKISLRCGQYYRVTGDAHTTREDSAFLYGFACLSGCSGKEKGKEILIPKHEVFMSECGDCRTGFCSTFRLECKTCRGSTEECCYNRKVDAQFGILFDHPKPDEDELHISSLVVKGLGKPYFGKC